MPLSVPDIESFKTYANITRSVDDDELDTFLAAAIGLTEGIVGRIKPVEITETHYGQSSPVLVLREAPVIELLSVSAPAVPGQTAVVYPLSDYVLDGPTGVVRSASGGRFWGDVVVTYTTGFGVVPDAVWLAILIIAGHLWETQRGSSPSVLAVQNGDQPQAGWSGFAIPNRAADLLTPYRQFRVS